MGGPSKLVLVTGVGCDTVASAIMVS